MEMREGPGQILNLIHGQLIGHVRRLGHQRVLDGARRALQSARYCTNVALTTRLP